MTPLILASGSPSRLELLSDIDVFPTSIISTDVDETPLKNEKPHLYCKRVAKMKFEAAANIIKEKQCIIITGDTTSVCAGQMLHKPDTADEVRSHLTLLSGRRNNVYSSIFCGIVVNNQIVRLLNRNVKTVVQFKRFTDQELEYVVSSNQGIGKCGGCQIAKLGGRYVKFIRGSFSNVIGLPQYETSQMLTALGYPLNERE